jgi:hypothetical protein
MQGDSAEGASVESVRGCAKQLSVIRRRSSTLNVKFRECEALLCPTEIHRERTLLSTIDLRPIYSDGEVRDYLHGEF